MTELERQPDQGGVAAPHALASNPGLAVTCPTPASEVPVGLPGGDRAAISGDPAAHGRESPIASSPWAELHLTAALNELSLTLRSVHDDSDLDLFYKKIQRMHSLLLRIRVRVEAEVWERSMRDYRPSRHAPSHKVKTVDDLLADL